MAKTTPPMVRGIAIAQALHALGVVPPQPGLSPIQHKILRHLRLGDDSAESTKVFLNAMNGDHPALRTVTLPLMLQRGLIAETKDHPMRPPSRNTDGSPRKFQTMLHSDIAITEIGQLTLWRFERKWEATKLRLPHKY